MGTEGFVIFSNLKKKLFNITPQEAVFNFFSIVIILRISKHIIDFFPGLEFANFQNLYLWKCFFISISAYLVILLLAFCYSRFFNILSASILFIGFLFTFYFLALLNSITFKIEDTLFIRICFLLFLIPVVYKYLKIKSSVVLFPKRQSSLFIVNVLISAWLIYSLLFFLEYNFNLSRVPYGDETGLWFIAPKNMILNNVLNAQLINYPGGRHPFGIPFICAFPAKIFGVNFTQTIFFMPLVIIVALFMFLKEIRFNKWFFIFFYTGLFNTFNNNSWIGQLCYRVVYGEGICLIFLLLIIYGIKIISDKQSVGLKEILAISFFIGLLSLSKSPASYFSIVFSLILIIVLQSKNHIKFNKAILSLIIIAVTLMPFLVWKIFAVKFGINSNIFYENLMDFKNRFKDVPLFSYGINMNMLKNAILAIKSNCPDAIYHAFLSLLFILITFRKKELVYLIPIVLFIFSIFFYYGFIYQGQDYGSSMRYLMPQALALFYLGAMGFDKTIRRVEQFKLAKPPEFFILFILGFLLIVRTF